jgi:hypothetical protein
MTWFQRIGVGLLAVILWLLSVGGAIVAIVFVRDLVLLIFALIVSRGGQNLQRLDNAFWSGAILSNVSVLILAVAVVIFAVATGEYHSRHVGTRQSWKVFGWTFAVELAIFLLAYFT